MAIYKKMRLRANGAKVGSGMQFTYVWATTCYDQKVMEGWPMAERMPRVGIGVLIIKGKQVLLSKRRGSHGAGEYAFPGGHLEYLESFATCAQRETREECGVEIENIRFQFVLNLIKYAPKHYVHLALVADWKSGEPRVLEPEKSEHWDWYDIGALPQPLFATCELAVRHYLHGGASYLDAEMPEV